MTRQRTPTGDRARPTATALFDPGRSATISDCGRYRYDLTRTLGGGPLVNFVMLNPSTADADLDDPTIRRCLGFARSWGCGRLVVTNLYAYRATDPGELWRLDRATAIGEFNDATLQVWGMTFLGMVGRVVCAWGVHGARHGRGAEVARMLRDKGARLYHLGLSKGGQPRHPLYLPGDLRPVPWEAAQ
jgi:hypothetical protein